MSLTLIPSRFLFRLATPCRRWEAAAEAKGAKAAASGTLPPALDAAYRLLPLESLDGRPPFAEVRAAWCEAGFACSLLVAGKRQPPWCRATRIDDSDSLQLWLDTRDVHNVHRATRFCHRFAAMPSGGGPRFEAPAAGLLPIHRAKELPRPIDPHQLRVAAARRDDGYRLDLWIPAGCLTGFDPREYPRLGFTYAVTDRELGVQTFAAGSPLPYAEDPSLWATLELGA